MIRFNDPRLTTLKARLQAAQWAQRLTKRAVRTAVPVTNYPAIPTLPAPSIENAPAAPYITQETHVIMEKITSAPVAPVRVFAPIRLGDAAPVHSSVIERHALGFGDAAVRNLASRCVAALERLVYESAFAHFASAAIEAAQTDGSTPTAWLEQTLHTLESETAAARIERSRHDARAKARSDRLRPLEFAVSARLTACESEIPQLAERVRSAQKHPFGNQSDSPYQKLIDAGLKPEQIALVGTENLVSKILEEAERHKARIAVLQSERPALRAFSADPRSSPAHLEGLAGFDAQIATSLRVVEEQDHINVAGLLTLSAHADRS